MREFLRAYYPNVPKQKLIKAAEVFANAYRCYVLLFDEEELKRFFIRLCTETDTLIKWAGLPGKP
jgi:hypothetical protein